MFGLGLIVGAAVVGVPLVWALFHQRKLRQLAEAAMKAAGQVSAAASQVADAAKKA